jgi:hypothetical protein
MQLRRTRAADSVGSSLWIEVCQAAIGAPGRREIAPLAFVVLHKSRHVPESDCFLLKCNASKLPMNFGAHCLFQPRRTGLRDASEQ